MRLGDYGDQYFVGGDCAGHQCVSGPRPQGANEARNDRLEALASIREPLKEDVDVTLETKTAARQSAAGVTEVSDAAEGLDRATNHLTKSAESFVFERKPPRGKGQSDGESRPESRETGDQ